MQRDIFVSSGTRGEYSPIITPNIYDGKCIHSYQVIDYGIPYEVQHKVGDICHCCHETVTYPRLMVEKRYGICLHSHTTDGNWGTSCIYHGKTCRFCQQVSKPLPEGVRWEDFRSQALVDAIQRVKPQIVIGSRWRDKSDGEVFTIIKIEKLRDYENWMCFIEPHPHGEFWYLSPENIAEKYEQV